MPGRQGNDRAWDSICLIDDTPVPNHCMNMIDCIVIGQIFQIFNLHQYHIGFFVGIQIFNLHQYHIGFFVGMKGTDGGIQFQGASGIPGYGR